MHLSDWLIQAALKYEHTNKEFNKKAGKIVKWPSGWPKNIACFVCKSCGHDPVTEHEYGSIPDYEQEMLAQGRYPKCEVEK